jgi:D-tyrosyl-tRNA(Tyr) deacylase
MRALVQRVSEAAVSVQGEQVGAIGPGLLAFIGVGRADGPAQADRMAERLWQLRIFEDAEGRPNLSAAELGLPLLVVSQFTLYADTSRGRRPSFTQAANPEQAAPLVDRVVQKLRDLGATVATGRFGATMHVALVNDGPFTLFLET